MITNESGTLISIPDLMNRWNTSRQYVWKRCKSGEIPATKIGERWYIDFEWVRKTEKPTNQVEQNA